VSNQEVARPIQVVGAVVNWHERCTQWLAGLADEPRPGAPRTVPDQDVEAMITRTLNGPAAHSRWQVPRATIARICRAFGLEPHRTESFKRVGVYPHPPSWAVPLVAETKHT
jgi:hypothetical protein